MSDSKTDERLHQATLWACEKLDDQSFRIETISADASFRRYYRIIRKNGDRSLVLMDAPPDKEDSGPFLDVAKRLRKAGLRAPRVYEFDLEMGFGIIEDLGDELFRSVIDENTAPEVFHGLFDVLERMAKTVDPVGLPPGDREFLQTELDLFTDWYLDRHRRRSLGDDEIETWAMLCNALIRNAEAQPQVFVHRDFHSCNLLHEAGKAPGIIDFQDAIHGPLSYDFVSLVWDRYIHWPRDRIEEWMEDMYRRLEPQVGLSTWVRYCDLMGLQRNLKIVGIFARLCHRDGKQEYIEMIPMFYRYLLDVIPLYPEFSDFRKILEDPTCAP